MFDEEMGRIVFFWEVNTGVASCLISNKSVAVLKEYNFHRHYDMTSIKHLLKMPIVQRSVLPVSSALYSFL